MRAAAVRKQHVFEWAMHPASRAASRVPCAFTQVRIVGPEERPGAKALGPPYSHLHRCRSRPRFSKLRFGGPAARALWSPQRAGSGVQCAGGVMRRPIAVVPCAWRTAILEDLRPCQAAASGRAGGRARTVYKNSRRAVVLLPGVAFGKLVFFATAALVAYRARLPMASISHIQRLPWSR